MNQAFRISSVALGLLLLGLLLACSSAETPEPQIIEVEQQVVVEKEVIK